MISFTLITLGALLLYAALTGRAVALLRAILFGTTDTQAKSALPQGTATYTSPTARDSRPPAYTTSS